MQTCAIKHSHRLQYERGQDIDMDVTAGWIEQMAGAAVMCS